MTVTGKGTLSRNLGQGVEIGFPPFFCSQISRGPGQRPGVLRLAQGLA